MNDMIKRFAFVSDFDRTISHEDFYRIIIDNYLTEDKRLYFLKRMADGLIDIPLLNDVFAAAGLTEEETDRAISTIRIDESFKKTIADTVRLGGDFIILSAGTDYYIRKILDHMDLGEYGKDEEDGEDREYKLRLISNPGEFIPDNMYGASSKSSGKRAAFAEAPTGRILITPDSSKPYYHKDYGIDKGLVIDALRSDYDYIIFAGDSLPDLTAAAKADMVWARSALPNILDEHGIPYHRFDTFADIDVKACVSQYMSRL